jgi:hypothetical protein
MEQHHQETTGSSAAVTERGRAVADTAKEHAGAVAHDASGQVSELVHEARDKLQVQGQAQTDRTAEMLRNWSGQLRAMAAGESAPQGQLVRYARDGADRLDGVARRLSERGFDGSLEDLTAYARRRPGMFLAGAFAAGIVAGRLVRNADTQRVMERADEAGHEPTPVQRAEDWPQPTWAESGALT